MKAKYRVVRRIVNDVETYAIHDAYYYQHDDKDRVINISYEKISPVAESFQKLKDEADAIKKAFEEPVLEYSDYY